MDDTKLFKIQIKGMAYRFAPLDLEDVARMSVIIAMEPSQGVVMKSVFAPLKRAAVAEDWDELTTRFVNKEVPFEDFMDLLKKLTKRTADYLKEPGASGDGE